MSEPPQGVEAGVPLARLTTVRTGGSGAYFARPESTEQLAELIRWATDSRLALEVIGSGSNLLIADSGFEGLVVKLDGELAAIERHGDRVFCGGGMRLPSAAAKTAGWGLAGLEFGVNIPGTVGGAVRMNANAYGGELARVLEWVEITDPAGSRRLPPESLGFTYRNSSLEPGQVVAKAAFRLTPDQPDRIRARLAEMRSKRHEAQPSGIKTFGSTFKNPDPDLSGGRTAGQLLEAAGCRGLAVGDAGFSEKHANFVENRGAATTAQVLAVMAEGRRRVYEQTGVLLEPEVQTIGPVQWPQQWNPVGMPADPERD